MNKIVISIAIGLISLTNCLAQTKDLLVKVTEQNCQGESIELYIPKDWIKIQKEDYDGGFIKSYLFSDYSIVSLQCGIIPNSLDIEALKSCGVNSREISVNGIAISYNNVFDDNKPIFDKAFDRTLID